MNFTFVVFNTDFIEFDSKYVYIFENEIPNKLELGIICVYGHI